MSVTYAGRQERVDRAKNLKALQEARNKFKGARGFFKYDPGFVFNPSPSEITTRWSDPSKVARRKYYGWKVVTIERGKNFFKLHEEEINRSKNHCERNGQILLEISVEQAAAIHAEYIIQAEMRISKDFQDVVDALGQMGMSRDADHNKRLIEHGKKRRFSKQDQEKSAEDRADRIYRQVESDITRSQGRTVQAISQDEMRERLSESGMNPDELTAPDMGIPGTLFDNDGVLEVRLTDDPDRAVDDFNDVSL